MGIFRMPLFVRQMIFSIAVCMAMVAVSVATASVRSESARGAFYGISVDMHSVPVETPALTKATPVPEVASGRLLSNDDVIPTQPGPTDTSEMNWTGITIVGSVALTAVLLKTDQRSSDVLSAWKARHHFLDQSSRFMSGLGDGRPTSAFFAAVYAYSLITGDNNAARLGSIGLESFALSGVATQVLKQVFSRQRPNVSTRTGGASFGPFAMFRQRGSVKHGMSFFDAFPSGHTATMFSAAATISDICQRRWITYSSYTIAVMVGVSRITERAHWSSDVFVGGLVGYYSTKLIESLSHDARNFSLAPEADDRGVGLTLSIAR